MATQLIKLNTLQLNQKGIWVNPDKIGDFNYSDGADEEKYLINVLENAKDISLDSAELRQACQDWVASYHLSAVRANLLKTLKLPVGARLLEVGCGCGAVTRYLGEQAFQVDAVEGSAVRAQISALHCRDLDNVQIIEHNFNTLELPPAHYDAVLFIGVLEYAARFIDVPELTAEQAVMALLNKAAASVKDDGIIITAIENRMGLKYIDGAFEDHLALADVGVNDYEGYEFAGIKTYDHRQWQKLIEGSGLVHRLFYPFADYKFPELVINGNVDHNTVAYLANRIRSQDPISSWQFSSVEHEKWSSIIDSRSLNHSSNSFGLIIAKTKQALEDRFTCNWAVFDDVAIKKDLRIDINDITINNKSINNNDIGQVFNKLPEYNVSLVNNWHYQLSANPQTGTLVKLTQELALLINSAGPQRRLFDHDQIFIADNDQQIEYSKAWEMPTDVSLVQQLFHFLLGFCKVNQKLLSSMSALNYTSVSDLILHCLQQSGTQQQHCFDDLICQENLFRQQVMIYPTLVEDDLAFLITGHDKFQFRHINSQLFWSDQTDVFVADQSSTKRIKQIPSVQCIQFTNIKTANRQLRFDPCDHEYGNGHFMHLQSFTVIDTYGNPLITTEKSCGLDYLSGIHELEPVDQGKHIYQVTGIDPQIKFSLAEDLTKITDRYNVEIKLQWLGC